MPRTRLPRLLSGTTTGPCTRSRNSGGISSKYARALSSNSARVITIKEYDRRMRRVIVLLSVVVFAGVVAFVFLRHGESSEALCEPVERLLSQGNLAAARAERESVRGRADAGWNEYLDG